MTTCIVCHTCICWKWWFTIWRKASVTRGNDIHASHSVFSPFPKNCDVTSQPVKIMYYFIETEIKPVKFAGSQFHTDINRHPAPADLVAGKPLRGLASLSEAAYMWKCWTPSFLSNKLPLLMWINLQNEYLYHKKSKKSIPQVKILSNCTTSRPIIISMCL